MTVDEINSALCSMRCLPKGKLSTLVTYLIGQWGNNLTSPPQGCGTPSHIIQISGAGTAGANQIYVQLPPPDDAVFLAANGWTVGCVSGTISDFPSADVIYESAILYDPSKLCPCDWVIGTGLGSNPAPTGQYLASSPEVVWLPSSAVATWFDSGGPHVGDLATFLATADLPTVSSIDINGSALLTIVGLQTLPALATLVLSNNSLGYLDVSGCTALTTLNCSSNASLTSLTLTGCTALTTLDCNTCDLTALNVSTLTSLQTLWCYGNSSLTSITGLLNCTLLQDLLCGTSDITGTLDVHGLTLLVNFNCAYNPNLTTLIVTNCTGLLTLECNSCALSDLDVTTCTSIQDIDCSGNVIGTLGGDLHMAGISTLNYLACSDNSLSSVVITLNTLLENVYVHNNVLTQVCVNTILFDIDNNGLPGFFSREIFTYGQTPPRVPDAGPPNGAAAKASLIAKTWVVNTD